MTCIIGLKHKGKVYIGGDSAGVAGLSVDIRSDTKVFKRGLFIMGFTSSFRMGQLLMCALQVPKQKKSQKDYDFMVTTFIDAVRKCLKDGGFATTQNEQEIGGSFIVGYKNKLYYVDGDYQVGVPSMQYTAIGCGSDLALGAMHVLSTVSNKKPGSMIRSALEAAVEFNGGVRPPFTIIDNAGKNKAEKTDDR